MGAPGSFALNLDERLVIEKMLKEGCRSGTIASTLNRSHSCIKQEVRKMGGKAHYDGRKSQQRADENKRAQARCLMKGFTEEQKTLIDKLIAEKESICRIAQITGVSNHRISSYIEREGIPYKPRTNASFSRRIEALEQQFEILFDLVKELKK